MPFIRTVCGDIPPEELGVCLPHEHLLGQPPQGLATQDLILDSEPAATQEMLWFRQAGGRALVEMSTQDYGRNAAGLRRVAQASNIHIICATGFNKEKFSHPFLEGRSVDELAAGFIDEVERGIAGSGIRSGVIKAASELNRISANAERLFLAAAQAHQATGAPVSTHTEAGTMALEQAGLLISAGVVPEHIIIGHLDRKLEWDALLRVARTGVYLGIDQIGKEKYYPDSLRVEMIQRLVAEGFGERILLSGDLAKRSYLPAYGIGGGPGFTYILWRFVPWLRQAGLPEEVIQDLIVRNPARALTFAITKPTS